MKTIKKTYRSRYQFNIAMNKEEFDIMQRLKQKHALNITGAFKIFLKHHLEKLEK
jgi:hypothetical protein